ncbi:MAG: hypothetical protein EA376_00920 [Phycisphaeraceae bacterium]|nr:MAG: hypothetical protein EA376_00920 [Phycisphaeraceae bacterium]
MGFVGDQNATNLAAGVRLAMAVLPENTAGRIALFSDGNETSDSLLAAARAAAGAGVPIDVYPVRYDIEREVVFERLSVPPTARLGQTVNLRFVLNSTIATSGRLTLLAGDDPIDLDPDSPGSSTIIDLRAGVNVVTVPLTMDRLGPRRFNAYFEPLDEADDTIVENNTALAVTFVASEGSVLVYAEDLLSAEPVVSALEESGLRVEIRSPTEEGHQSLIDLGAHDAVVLLDTSAYQFSRRQQDELRAYVHDLGGGLMKVGGPNSFGAGGWIGSPLADALPVRLDPPQERRMPRGALAILMHSCEMPRGNYWGQQTALAALEALSSQDLIGIVEFDWGQRGFGWTLPLSVVGDRSAARRAISNLSFGDAKDFNAMMGMAIAGLEQVAAGQKHAVLISDGDPSPPSRQVMQRYIDAGVAVSTVLVFPHSNNPNSPDWQRMRDIANATGGNHYVINQQGDLASLPQIFVKEAQTIRRTLIWEGEPFTPSIVGGISEPLRGIGPALPPLRGYVVTSERDGLALVTMRGEENDPLLAQWQHGLGRTVAFMSDTGTRWSPAWAAWEQQRSFWEQHVRWAMRPSGSANVNVITEDRGDETRVIVEASDAEGDPLNFASFAGRLVRPDLESESIELRQTGAGRYEGRFESAEAGSYLLNLRYESARTGDDGAPVVERGGVQAAVVRPFADEFRALSDNAALLMQVAELTGGRILDPNPDIAELFSRENVVIPMATRSIWLALALAAIGLFLADVAVRRVRVDLRAGVRVVKKALSRQRTASERPIDAMRAARERARGVLDERGAGQAMDLPRQTPAAQKTKPESAGVKFEASEERLRSGAASPVDAPPGADRPKPPSDTGAGAGKKDEDEEQGMSRLMRAKRRARDAMRDEERNDDDKNQN